MNKKLIVGSLLALFLVSCGQNNDLPSNSDEKNSTSQNESSEKETLDKAGQCFEHQKLKYKIFDEDEVTLYDFDNSLTDLEIPESVSYEGKDYNVTSVNFQCENFSENYIRQLVLPKNLKNFSTDYFRFATLEINSVIYKGSISDWSQVKVDSGENGILSKCNNFYFTENDKLKNAQSYTEIVIPEGTKRINDCAYQIKAIKKDYESVGGITKVYLPKSIEYIGDELFYWTLTNLEFYYDGTLEDWLNIDYIGLNFISGVNLKDNNGNYYQPTTINIKEGVDEIKANTFANFMSLNKISLPSSLKVINSYAFSHCSSLQEVNFPNALSCIGNNAFQECRIKDIVIPDSVKEIGAFAFAYNESTSIKLSNSIKKISKGTFELCGVNSFVIPASVEIIESNILTGCNLNELTIPNTVKKVCSYALAGTNINKLYIHSNIESVSPFVLFGEENMANTEVYIIGNENPNWHKKAFEHAKNVTIVKGGQ